MRSPRSRPSPFVSKCRYHAEHPKRYVWWRVTAKVSNGRVIYPYRGR